MDFIFALAGNPNVGKSSLFNTLTGIGAVTANYPGKTVEINSGTVHASGVKIGLLDLPGTYALTPVSEDQRIASQGVLEGNPDAVIVVLDATNLARNLYLLLEIIDVGIPVVAALNLSDEAERKGIETDVGKLSSLLGVPVIPTVATRGEGLPALLEAAVAASKAARGDTLRPAGRPPASAVDSTLPRIEERNARAESIAAQTQEHKSVSAPGRLWRLATSPATGLPLLAAVLAGLFAFLSVVGNLLSTLISTAWQAAVSPLLLSLIHAVAGDGVVARILLWGPDAGLQAALTVGIPYVLTFYFILAFLEDSGYLNSVAFLTDRIMRLFGLHGRAIIPLVSGAGCSVPAIMGMRMLSTPRERTIAGTLIVMIPCSARTAVILGALTGLAGWQWGLALFLVNGALIALSGAALNKVLPGESDGLVMEMFPFRMPSLASITLKTWRRFKDFIFVATPIVLIGSMALGALYETGLIWKLSGPLAPVMEGWLGLPAVAGLTLIFAVLRKELALQLLVALAIVRYGPGGGNLLTFMGPPQLFVYALVNTIAIPCIATISVLGKELGWKRTAGILTFTLAVALLFGGAAHWILAAMGAK